MSPKVLERISTGHFLPPKMRGRETSTIFQTVSPRINPPAAYEGLSPSFRLVRSTPITATKNNVPPNSTLVITVLVLRTSTSRKPCTLRSPPICFLSTHRVHPCVVLLRRITLSRTRSDVLEAASPTGGSLACCSRNCPAPARRPPGRCSRRP